MPGITFTSYVPTALVGVNSPSPTLAAEVATGLPIPTGAFPGNVFYLTEQQANQLSQVAVNGAFQFTCHAGWYMVAQVAAGATAANVTAGAIGAQAAIPATQAAESANVPPVAVVTDYAHALSTTGGIGINPVVFLGPVTPGNYTIVQVQGDASVLLQASQTIALGDLVLSSTSALGSTVPTQSGNPTFAQSAEVVGLVETALPSATPGGALTLTAAAAASGGTTVYTGTITGGGSNAYEGLYFTITGFDLAVNNGTFLCTASTTTTLTLTNAAGVADTHAGTATPINLVRVNVRFPFGII